MSVSAHRCRCGRVPGTRSRQAAHNQHETWVQCPGCGRAGESVVETARDDASAVALWNDGKEREW
ncbi:hypothetical protein [Sphingobium sp.]|uniref:hypothetical protein n=1 Tax=Sphingobium sp. TaxID=1912891 RepID=UPI003BB4E42B